MGVETSRPTPGSYPRWSLFGVSLLHSVVFALAALRLTWRPWPALVALLATLALVHLATAVASAWQRSLLRLSWTWSSGLSVFAFAALTWTLAADVGFLIAVYAAVGRGLGAALVAIWALLAAFTVPIAWWGFATVGPRLQARRLGVGAVLFLIAALLGVIERYRSAHLSRFDIDAADADRRLATLAREVPRQTDARDTPGARSARQAVRCSNPPSRDALSVFIAAFAANRTGTRASVEKPALGQHACVQADDLASAFEKVRHIVAEQGMGSPLQIDIVTGHAPVTRVMALLDALQFRPGIDGVCRGSRCVLPWQLVAFDGFAGYHPLSYVKDVRLGVSLESVAGAFGLDVTSSDRWQRVETRSYVVDGGDVHELRRLQNPQQLTADGVLKFVQAAQGHIEAAQDDSGKFRYLLQPFTGAVDERSFNLPRQAGTTLVECELGAKGKVSKRVIRRSLNLMRGYEKEGEGPQGESLAALTVRGQAARLGETALPLVAFLGCRGRVGTKYDQLIGHLTRYLLAVQAPNGRFREGIQLDRGEILDEDRPLYADGQALLALVLVESLLMDPALQARLPGDWPKPEVVHGAVERAMDYYANDHWPEPLRELFFIEENWHCLAARAALDVHPHRAYQQFCLDYVAFKSRLILDESSNVDWDYQGGMGFGNIIPPHSAGSAGFGEALTAAIALRRALGLATDSQEALLVSVLSFVLRQQWTPQNCFACATDAALGGVAEHVHSPQTRIDYTQHAWAAMGHGARILGLVGDRS